MATVSPEREAERRARFLNRIDGRVTKAKAAIRRVGELGNRKSNTYTQAEVEQIHGALATAVQDAMERFAPPASKATDDFSLEVQAGNGAAA